MKGPLYISDDGQKQGTQAEVEAYEASLNPIAKFKFPWHQKVPSGWWTTCTETDVWESVDPKAAIDLLNLMPLVEDLRQAMTKEYPDWRTHEYDGGWAFRLVSTQALLLAYEKALGVKA